MSDIKNPNRIAAGEAAFEALKEKRGTSAKAIMAYVRSGKEVDSGVNRCRVRSACEDVLGLEECLDILRK